MDMAIPWTTKSYRVTAGAPCISGNDAFTPKPCRNLKSSSNKSFVGNNTAVCAAALIYKLFTRHRVIDDTTSEQVAQSAGAVEDTDCTAAEG